MKVRRGGKPRRAPVSVSEHLILKVLEQCVACQSPEVSLIPMSDAIALGKLSAAIAGLTGFRGFADANQDRGELPLLSHLPHALAMVTCVREYLHDQRLSVASEISRLCLPIDAH